MDEIDEKIILILKKNSRTPFVEIADKTGLTEGAIRLRVNKLIKEGKIRKFTIDTEEEIKAIVTVATFTTIPTTQIANAIRELGIERVYEVSGDYEIICFVQSGSVVELDKLIEKIRKIKGVIKTTTYMVLK